MSSNITCMTIAGALLCVLSMRALGMGGDYPIDADGNIVSQQPDWPAGLADLINSGPVFGGHWVNANSEFFFLGNTASLNRFLNRYGDLKNTPLVVILHAGSARRSDLWGDKPAERYDWKVIVRKRGWGAPAKTDTPQGEWTVTIDVWIDHGIRLADLVMPTSIHVTSAGEVDAFVSTHQDAQATPAGGELRAAPAK